MKGIKYFEAIICIKIGVNSSNDFEYSIVNILGQNVNKGVLNQGENTINMSSVSSGFYFVKVLDNQSKEFVLYKLIKE